jgi:hypothetical protein
MVAPTPCFGRVEQLASLKVEAALNGGVGWERQKKARVLVSKSCAQAEHLVFSILQIVQTPKTIDALRAHPTSVKKNSAAVPSPSNLIVSNCS